MRVLPRAGIFAIVLMLFASISGYSAQSGKGYLPLRADDVTWDPGSDEGKRLKERLHPELETLVVALKDSGPTLEENDIAVVMFEESGTKVGLDIRLMSAVLPRGSEGSILSPMLNDRVVQAVAPITSQPKLLEDDSEITVSELGRYVKEAGARRRM